MKKIILLILFVVILAFPVLAANTVIRTGSTINITDIDSDWSLTDIFSHYTRGAKLFSIQFNPGAADDQAVIKNNSDTGAPMFDVSCENIYDQRIKYFGDKRKLPVLDYDAGTYSAGATIIIELGE